MKEIVCKGYITENGKADVNYSDIFSFLIREVGTKVVHYQSDLYYELKRIKEAINNLEEIQILVGLRECGVDGNEFIKMKESQPDVYNVNYIAVYVINIEIENNDITVTLRERSDVNAECEN